MSNQTYDEDSIHNRTLRSPITAKFFRQAIFRHSSHFHQSMTPTTLTLAQTYRYLSIQNNVMLNQSQVNNIRNASHVSSSIVVLSTLPAVFSEMFLTLNFQLDGLLRRGRCALKLSTISGVKEFYGF